MSTVPLSEWVEVLESGSRPKGGIKDDKGDVPSLGAEHLSDDGSFNFIKVKRIPFDFYEGLKKGKIASDDILIVKDGATTGKVSFVNGDFPFQDAAINEHIFRLSVDARKADPRFVFRYLQSPLGQMEIMKDFRGATVGGIGRTFLEKVSLPNIGREEQQRIAAILDKADGIRRKRKDTLLMADDLLKSFFRKSFFGSGIDWPVRPLRYVSELINGDRSSNYPSGKDIVDQGILFLNTKNISGSELTLDERVFITEEKFRSLTRGKLRQKDLVMTLRGSIGQCAIFDCGYDTGFINAQMMIIRPGTKVTSNYLHRLLIHPTTQHQMLREKSGSAVPQLTAKQIGDFEIPIPPIEAQREFDDVAYRIQLGYQKAKEALESSRELFSSLSQRAFRGEL